MKLIRKFKQSRLGQTLMRMRNNLLDSYYWSQSLREFKQRMAHVNRLPDLVDLLWTYQGSGHYRYLIPNQDRGEILTLAQRVQALEPRVIVELGTRDGSTLLLWTQIASQHVISIDLPGGIHGGGYTEQRGRLYRAFTENRSIHLHLLRMDSQQDSTRTELETILNGQPIDFLFIDADHRYEGVKRDYELYAPLVRSGGLIAFHDIRPNISDQSIQVYRLWDKIKTTARTEEFIHEPYTGRYGIGLIYR